VSITRGKTFGTLFEAAFTTTTALSTGSKSTISVEIATAAVKASSALTIVPTTFAAEWATWTTVSTFEATATKSTGTTTATESARTLAAKSEFTATTAFVVIRQHATTFLSIHPDAVFTADRTTIRKNRDKALCKVFCTVTACEV
jgi:hypothetical protein